VARKSRLQLLLPPVIAGVGCVAVFLLAIVLAPRATPPAIAAAPPARPAPAPAPPPAMRANLSRDVALGEEASWNPGGGPATFRADDIAVSVRSIDADETSYEAVVRQGRRAPLVIRTGEMPPIGCCTISVGRLDRTGARYVMLATFTGGLHCCWRIQMALPDGPRRRVLEVGAFDAPYNLGDQVTGVRDFDGDGRIDVVMGDDAFLYSFTGYTSSAAPLEIRNVLDGRVVNVSAARRYRGMHLRMMASLREGCTAGDHGFRNSACAAYVATAARVGRFDAAWSEMLRVYERDDLIDGRPFPERLRAMLVARGYIAARH
jgi:hypothetical protein